MLTNVNEHLLADIGEQIRKKRISGNLTQSDLAVKAGISRRTVQAIERGESISLSHFIAILRILDLLDVFTAFFDKETISPLLVAKQKGTIRQRARKSKHKLTESDYQW